MAAAAGAEFHPALFLGENILEWRNALALAMVSAGIWWVTTERRPLVAARPASCQPTGKGSA